MIRQAGSFISDDTRLYYEQCGKGPPLVLLHGRAQDMHRFDLLTPVLAERFRVILPELRGHGRSERGAEEMTITQIALDLRSLLEHLGDPKVHLIGFGEGGLASLMFAAAFPELSGRIIVSEVCGSRKGLRQPFRTMGTLIWRWHQVLALFSPRAARRLEMYELMARQKGFLFNLLDRVESPCLMMTSEGGIVRLEETVRIANAIPDSDIVVIPQASHVLSERAILMTVDRMIDFLEDGWMAL